MSLTDLHDLARWVDADGLAAHLSEVEDVAARARTAGLTTVAIDVIEDRAAPTPVRVRAFGHLVTSIARTAPAAFAAA